MQVVKDLTPVMQDYISAGQWALPDAERLRVDITDELDDASLLELEITRVRNGSGGPNAEVCRDRRLVRNFSCGRITTVGTTGTRLRSGPQLVPLQQWFAEAEHEFIRIHVFDAIHEYFLRPQWQKLQPVN